MNYTKEYFAKWKPHALSSGFTPDYEDMAEHANELLPQIKAAWMADLIKNAPSLVVNSPCDFSISWPNDTALTPPFTAKLICLSNYKSQSQMKRVETMKK